MIQPSTLPFAMNSPVLSFGSEREAQITFEDMCTHMGVIGGTGAGKSTAVAKRIAKIFMLNDCGVLLTTVKPSDTLEYIDWALSCKREKDLVIFSPNGLHKLDLINYAASTAHPEMIVPSVTQTFEQGFSLSESGLSRNSNDSGKHFVLSGMLFFQMAVYLLFFSAEEITLANINQIIRSAALSDDQVDDPVWRDNSYNAACLAELAYLLDNDKLAEAFTHDAQECRSFWSDEYPKRDREERSSVLSTLQNYLVKLNHGVVRNIFFNDGQTTITPEECFEQNKIVILDFPTKVHRNAGRTVQVLALYTFLQAFERRDVKPDTKPYLFQSDEFASFCANAPFFVEALATLRSSRGSFLALSQSISAIQHEMGGDKAKHAMDAMMANLSNIIVMNVGSNPSSQRWASELFGAVRRTKVSTGQNSSVNANQDQVKSSENHGSNTTFSEVIEAQLLPIDFTKLRKGGSDKPPQAYIYRSGQAWPNGKNHILVELDQSF